MKRLAIYYLIFACIHATAQQAWPLPPLPFLDTVTPSLQLKLRAKYEQDRAAIQLKGREGSYVKNLLEQRYEYVVKTINMDYLMADDPITAKMREIADHIYASNPQLKRETTLYTFRSHTPNAVSFGEGTLCVMLGLIERVTNEDVLAYVICHEMAHHHLDHSNQEITRRAQLNYDKGLKQQIDAIMASPYGRYSRMKALFNNLEISINKHSRSRELEADSVGLQYFLRTKYNPLAALQTMKVLDHADSGLYQKNIDLKKHFDFKDQPFKPSWNAYNPSAVWHAMPDQSDSSKTHPNCAKRFSALKRQLKADDVSDEKLTQGISIDPIKRLAALEKITAHYHFKEYGKALFESLVLIEQMPSDHYPYAMATKSLFQLFKAQKNHQLGKVLELPDPRFEENYNRVLTFVHSLRLHELANITYHFAINQSETFFQQEEFLHAVWLASTLDVSKLDPDKVREDYQQLFPNGKYLRSMQKFNNITR